MAEIRYDDCAIPEMDSELFKNAGTISVWLEKQPTAVRVQLAQKIFSSLLSGATQPNSAPSHACVKLCGFVQLCSKAGPRDEGLWRWAFSEDTALTLFHFYTEWSEHDPHRSMRLALDLVSRLFTQNPDPIIGAAIRAAVLESVVAVVGRQSSRSAAKASLQALSYFLGRQVVTVWDVEQTYRKVKPSVAELRGCQLWGSFVTDVFSWMTLHNVCPVAGKLLVQLFQELRNAALSGLSEAEPSLGNKDGSLDGFSIEIWQEWMQDGVETNPNVLEAVKNYIYAPLFKADRQSSLTLLEGFVQQKVLDGPAALLRLTGLEIGRKAGLVEEPGSHAAARPTGEMVTIQKEVLEVFMVHPSHMVRSSALSLLLSSPFTSRPVSSETFELLRRHLPMYYADYDTKFRQEILGFSRILICRVKNVITAAKKNLSKSAELYNPLLPAIPKKPTAAELLGSEEEVRDILNQHEEFLDWYIHFLRDELIPTASYQRHISALRALVPVVKFGKRSSGSDNDIDETGLTSVFSDSTFLRLLMDLVIDPFDDVRETASAILLLLPPRFAVKNINSGAGTLTPLAAMQEFCDRAITLASRTGRADHGNGAARAQGILYSWLESPQKQMELVSTTLQRLERKLSRAAEDLGRAAMEDSVHVDFASLTYIWQVLVNSNSGTASDREIVDQLQRRILASCERVWVVVRHVLCDDSPEGHFPEEMEAIQGLDTKDLLSYSFRAVHESSNLMQTMIKGLGTVDSSPVNTFRPPLDVFNGVGSLTFNQLSTLRHRGAFSTVSSTFTTCCQLTVNLRKVFPDMPESENHLTRWYKGSLACILNQVSTTRRSAGIPALVIGILAANAVSPSFGEVFDTLVEIAQKPARITETDGSNLPQVHALNSLRGIFRSSLLSKRAETYLPMTLQLAASCLKSEVWAIRNCGLLLLRSLIDCLFGTGESKYSMESGWDGHTIRISYAKYPSLPGVLLSLLNPSDKSLDSGSISSSYQSSAAEAVFPALDIIRRAGPPQEHRVVLYDYVKQYLGSHLWHVREMAARTLTSFLLHGDWLEPIRELIRHSLHGSNRLHGALLTVRFLLERRMEVDADATKDDVPILISVLDNLLIDSMSLIPCSDVHAALVDIFNLLTSYGFSGSLPPCTAPSRSLMSTADDLKNDWNTSALLRMQLGILAVHEAANSAAIDILRVRLNKTLEVDVDTACEMMKTMAEVLHKRPVPDVWLQLCDLYLEAHSHTASPESRALILRNLKDVMDLLVRGGHVSLLPDCRSLERLWATLQCGEINPTLSHAILEISGTLAAATVLRNEAIYSGDGRQIRSWAALITDALHVCNTFDTRFAAAEALRAFFLPIHGFFVTVQHALPPWFLPCALALYDALNDDDNEIRDVAAEAASSVLSGRMTPLVAAERLIDYLDSFFGGNAEFDAAVVCRMAGQQQNLPTWPSSWPKGDSGSDGKTYTELTSAEELLAQAMQFDDSLFAVEEQNLFIDEVRESKRWRRVFLRGTTIKKGEETEAVVRLRDWAASGLRNLVNLAKREEDRPLGWASSQHVFAICTAVLISSGALSEKMQGDDEMRSLLWEFREAGKASRVHETLLHLASSILEKHGS